MWRLAQMQKVNEAIHWNNLQFGPLKFYLHTHSAIYLLENLDFQFITN